jgi:hypothetical protein
MRFLYSATVITRRDGRVPRLFVRWFHIFWNHVPKLDAGIRCHFYSMGALSVYEERMSRGFHRRNYFARGWSRHDVFWTSERVGAIAHLPCLDCWASLCDDGDDPRGIWRCSNYRKLALLILGLIMFGFWGQVGWFVAVTVIGLSIWYFRVHRKPPHSS